MALDRLITLRLMSEGMRDEHGIYVDGPITEIRVWAARLDAIAGRDLSSVGLRDSGVASWRIRWRSDVIEAARNLQLNHEVIADGSTYLITSAGETDGRTTNLETASRSLSTRKRWVDIEAAEQNV